MTSREKTLIGLSVLLAVLFFAMSIALCSIAEENKKYKAILDIACDYSGDVSTCKQGIKMFKGMSLKDLENFNVPKTY